MLLITLIILSGLPWVVGLFLAFLHFNETLSVNGSMRGKLLGTTIFIIPIVLALGVYSVTEVGEVLDLYSYLMMPLTLPALCVSVFNKGLDNLGFQLLAIVSNGLLGFLIGAVFSGAREERYHMTVVGIFLSVIVQWLSASTVILHWLFS